MTAAEQIEQTAADMGLAMKAKFVPWSLSRNAGEQPCLNWKITLEKNGKAILTTEYMMGSGHCASYKRGDNSIHQAELIKRECEQGISKAGALSLANVLHSLCSDAEAIDYPTYEEYASSLDMEEDSRAGEKIYRACVEIGLKLRAALGEDGLAKLQEATRDL